MLIAILILEIVLFLWITILASYIIRSVTKSNDESFAELMNAMIHIDDLRAKVDEAVANGQTEVDLTSLLE